MEVLTKLELAHLRYVFNLWKRSMGNTYPHQPENSAYTIGILRIVPALRKSAFFDVSKALPCSVLLVTCLSCLNNKLYGL